jgi:hypothetical protein
MPHDTQKPATERQDADDVTIQDPEYDAGFDAVDTPPAEPAKKEEKPPQDPPPAEPQDSPKDDKKDDKPPQDPPPAEPQDSPKDDKKETTPPAEPESAMAKAEAAGAKLQEPPPEEGGTVLEALPEDDRALVQSPQFAEWFNRQKPHIQKMGMQGGVEGAMTVLDFYKSSTVKPAAPSPREDSTKQLIAELGDVSIRTATGESVKLSEYMKEYGDLGEAIAVIADKIAAKRTPSDSGSDRVSKLEGQLAEMRFWESVSEAHSDGRKISRSPEFKEWAKGTSPAMQRLLRSDNPDHAVLALDAYKEFRVSQAKAKTTTVKDRTNAMHGDTARGGKQGATPRRTQDDPDADFDSGFLEGAK